MYVVFDPGNNTFITPQYEQFTPNIGFFSNDPYASSRWNFKYVIARYPDLTPTDQLPQFLHDLFTNFKNDLINMNQNAVF